MKAIQFTLGIAVITLLFGGSMALKSKLKYEADGYEINKLIAEYKAMGVPTKGSDVFQPIPNSENAWSDIGPLLMNKNGRGNGPLYRSGIALDLVYGGTAKDLDLMHKYLAINAAKRSIITEVLKKKPKMQVVHDYNEGFLMLLPEYATMKSVCKDYCLAAYAAGLEGKNDVMLENIRSANLFAKHCFSRSELIGTLVGVAIQKMLVGTGLRLAEEAPSTKATLQLLFSNPDFYGKADLKRTFQGEMLAQIVTCRYLDSPLIDRKKYPAPMDHIFPFPSFEEITKAGAVHPDDYVPQSRNMRTLLRARLEHSKPFLSHLLAQKDLQTMPPIEEFGQIFDFSHDLPPAMESLAQTDADWEMTYANLCIDQEFSGAARSIWRALDTKTKTGAFPATLNQIGIPIHSMTNSEGYVYEAGRSGVSLRSNRLTMKNPAISLSFPVSLGLDPATMAKHEDIVRQYRFGKVNDAGTDVRYAIAPKPGPGAPPMAPKGSVPVKKSP